MTKVVIVSKALIAGAAQRKLEELARHKDIELVAVVPPGWHEPNVGWQMLERRFTAGYRMEVLPMAFNGRHHFHFYPGLEKLIQRERPDVLHMDEESFNPATFQGIRVGQALGARCLFYNYANIERRYPPPFSWFEQYNFRHAQAIVCNADAASIIRKHGYRGPISTLPQVGVDPELFAPAPPRPAERPFTVGYVGRLLEAKGLLDLLEACAPLPYVHLLLVGNGELREQTEAQAAALGMSNRLEIRSAVASTDVPSAMHDMDVLVLPSRTTSNWKEQFGRVLIEAMSCAIAVIGSSSGEIPNVIGDGGLVFPEGDTKALRNLIERLYDQPKLLTKLASQGRKRVLAHYTQAAVANAYAELYRSLHATS